jgi:hypothetical protein
MQARDKRVRPARDDKVVTAWNGLVVAALAEASILLDDRDDCLDAARSAAHLLLNKHLDDRGHLVRTSRDGVAGAAAGILEDYACFADGLLALYSVTGEPIWFDTASQLTQGVLERFTDDRGGFYDTADDAEGLLKRPQDPTDNATPSGQAMTASVLTTMFGLTGDATYKQCATDLVRRLSGLAERAPRFAGQTLAVAEALADGPRQVAVVGPHDQPAGRAMLRAAHVLTHPGAVVAPGDGTTAAVPLLEERPLVDGLPTAYSCRDFVCALPVTDPARLT